MPVATFDFYKVQVSDFSIKVSAMYRFSAVLQHSDFLQEFRVLQSMPKSQEVNISTSTKS